MPFYITGGLEDENKRVDELDLLRADNERLRAENLKVSHHCAELIQLLRDLGVSDDDIKSVATRVLG